MPILFIVLGLAAVGGIAYLAYYRKKKRREDLAIAAQQLGLEYSPQDLKGCLGLPFALLQKGDGRGTENVLDGTWQGMAVTEFDYWFYEQSTDAQGHSSKSYSYFSCAVTGIEAECAHLTLDRENLLTWLGDHLGLHDIEFESDAFNKAFNVKCKDKKFANDIVDARMMQWLLATDGGFQFEVCGQWILVYSRRRKPTELIPLLGTLEQFQQHVPHVVYELYGSGHPQ